MKKFFVLPCLFCAAVSCTKEKEEDGGVEAPVTSADEAANLEMLCKVWGVVKYFHPAFAPEPKAEPKYDIDRELLDLIPIAREKSSSELKERLVEWIDSLGYFEASADMWNTYVASKYADTEVKFLSDVKWIFDVEYLGSDLSERVANVYQAVREYPSKYAYEFGKDYDEEPYVALSNPNSAYRLLALFRYWNIIEYFFPAKYLTNTPWNEVLREYIPVFIEAEGYNAYLKAVARLVAEICDTHAFGMYYPLSGNKWISDLSLEVIDDKLYAAKVYEDNGEKHTIKPGDEILSIGGKTYEWAKDQYPLYFSLSNDASRDRTIKNSMITSSNSVVPVIFVSDGETQSEMFKAGEHSDRNSFPVEPLVNGYTLLMEGRVGYFNPGAYTTPPLTDMFKAFQNTEGIVIDMRYYPELPIFDLPYRYVDNTDRPFARFLQNDGFFPGCAFAVMGTTGEYAEYISEGSYGSKIVLLVNGDTQSAGECVTMVFQTLPNVTVIGSQTAGADGNIVSCHLPGGIPVVYSGLGVLYPDGTETQRHGIRLDREVRPTVEGLKAGRDELLDEAVHIILNGD